MRNVVLNDRRKLKMINLPNYNELKVLIIPIEILNLKTNILIIKWH